MAVVFCNSRLRIAQWEKYNLFLQTVKRFYLVKPVITFKSYTLQWYCWWQSNSLNSCCVMCVDGWFNTEQQCSGEIINSEICCHVFKHKLFILECKIILPYPLHTLHWPPLAASRWAYFEIRCNPFTRRRTAADVLTPFQRIWPVVAWFGERPTQEPWTCRIPHIHASGYVYSTKVVRIKTCLWFMSKWVRQLG